MSPERIAKDGTIKAPDFNPGYGCNINPEPRAQRRAIDSIGGIFSCQQKDVSQSKVSPQQATKLG
jgi:hypothetical protein